MAHSHHHQHTAGHGSFGNMLFSFLLNLAFSAIELFGGLFTGSISIISDAVHDFGDCLSIGTALLLEKKASHGPDGRYTYGYRRYSLFGALLTSAVLLAGSVIVIINAIGRFLAPVAVNESGMLLIAILGVVVNGVAAYKTSHGDNLNERALSLHMLEDVLGWIAILLGSILIKFTKWHWIDPALSIGIALFVLYHALKNTRGVLAVLLERAPEGADLSAIKEELLNIDGILDIHHIHLWSLDGNDRFLTLHARIPDDCTPTLYEELRGEMHRRLAHLEIMHATLELEHGSCDRAVCDGVTDRPCHEHHE